MWGTVQVCAFVVLSGVVMSQGAVESRVVSLAQGPVRGFRTTSYNVFDFFDIPYATGPTGPDKFKAPLPPPTWNDTRDAIDRAIRCPQPIIIPPSTPFTEDCLVANIFVPGTVKNNLPVLVVVHGGAYQIDDLSRTSFRGFVDSQRVIVVTFNYRLSVHGFLCLGTETAPGNAGMKDQVALLRWVRDNIENFGGNPNDVTITGCSAGGGAVDTLLLSNLTDGLFNKVIADSGCSTTPMAVQLDPLQNAKDHVFRLNFTNVDVENITAIDEFFTTTALDTLTLYHFLDNKNAYFFFQPCVERDIGQEMFLDDAPINILRSGNYKKLPILYGYAHHEGMFRLPWFNEWKVEMNENFSDFLPADLEFKNGQEKVELAQEVKEFYFGNDTVNDGSIIEYINYFSDSMFVTSIHRTVTLQVQADNSEVYLYDYSYVHNGSAFIPHTDIQGANHCDQVQAIIDTPFTSPDFLEISGAMRQIMLDFIYTGSPTPPGSNSSVTWLPAGANRSPHLSVGSSIEMLGVPLEARAAFWDTIYERYRRTPMPPNPNVTNTEPEPNAAATLVIANKQYWTMFAICIFMIVLGL